MSVVGELWCHFVELLWTFWRIKLSHNIDHNYLYSSRMFMKYHIGTYYTLHVSHSERNATNSSQLYHTHARDTKHVCHKHFFCMVPVHFQTGQFSENNFPKVIFPTPFLTNGQLRTTWNVEVYVSYSSQISMTLGRKKNYQFFTNYFRLQPETEIWKFITAPVDILFLFTGDVFSSIFFSHESQKKTLDQHFYFSDHSRWPSLDK